MSGTAQTQSEHHEKSAPPVRRSPGRPRSAAARRAVLDAAYAILVGGGLPEFSIEAVAARAGVAKTTIYRSWPTKGLLAFESFRDVFEAQLVFDRTGSPEEDLRSLVRSLVRVLSGPAGRLAASVMAEAQHDPKVRKLFLEHFSLPLRRRSTEVVRAGMKSGRFRSDLNIPRLLDALVGAVYLRLLLGRSLNKSWADALTLTLLHGSLFNP